MPAPPEIDGQFFQSENAFGERRAACVSGHLLIWAFR
jgi:hypothetical protein